MKETHTGPYALSAVKAQHRRRVVQQIRLPVSPAHHWGQSHYLLKGMRRHGEVRSLCIQQLALTWTGGLDEGKDSCTCRIKDKELRKRGVLNIPRKPLWEIVNSDERVVITSNALPIVSQFSTFTVFRGVMRGGRLPFHKGPGPAEDVS